MLFSPGSCRRLASAGAVSVSVALLLSGPVAAAPDTSAPSEPSAASAPPRRSDVQIVFDLALGGSTIGTREVTVRFTGARRVIEVVTDLTVAGVRHRSRSTGVFGGPTAAFTTVIEDGAGWMSLQGREYSPGRWRLLTTDASGARERTVDALLSSIQLHDPEAARYLSYGGPTGVLLAETGEVLRGLADPPDLARVRIGAEDVPVREVRMKGETGAPDARFGFGPDGNLLQTELRMFGALVTATARSVPPLQTFGTVDTIDTMGSGTTEESL
jgi:hypothetical protein